MVLAEASEPVNNSINEVLCRPPGHPEASFFVEYGNQKQCRRESISKPFRMPQLLVAHCRERPFFIGEVERRILLSEHFGRDGAEPIQIVAADEMTHVNERIH